MNLKPCPFCGEHKMLVLQGSKTKDGKVLWWRGGCVSCHTNGPSKPTEEEALAAWNVRVMPPEEEPERRGEAP